MKNLNKYLLALWAVLCLGACAEDHDELLPVPDTPGTQEPSKEIDPAAQWIRFDHEAVEQEVGEVFALYPSCSPEIKDLKDFVWDTSAPEIVSVKYDGALTAVCSAHAVGEATLTVSSSAYPTISATLRVVVKEAAGPDVPSDGKVRILAIGNSFSQDAVESYLWNLADAAGYDAIVANMYIGGCSLEQHLQNASADKGAYSYRLIENGVKTTKENAKLSEVITSQPWDYISLQEVSGRSGIYSYYETSLPEMYYYVVGKATKKDVKILLHQTWAYAQNSNHSDFPKYGRDQLAMYNAIIDATTKASNLVSIHKIVPAGTAIQNGRTTYIGDNFNRDGYHLEVNYGRFTAACTWFEAIFGDDVTTNSYCPANVSAAYGKLAKAAAHFAVGNPNAITDMVDFKVPPEAEGMDPGIYVDFGTSRSVAPWNNLTSATSKESVRLVDNKNAQTSVYLTLTKPFGGVNTAGPTSTTVDMPSTATSDSFWGNTGDAFSGTVTGPCEIELSGLDETASYEIAFFSGRNGSSDNRDTQFTVAGTVAETKIAQSAANTKELTVFASVRPASGGKITITVTSGPSNNNKNGFFYVNAMTIKQK